MNGKFYKSKHLASKAATREQVSSSTSDDEALVTIHSLSATLRGNWIIDSGATCHMCNEKELFRELSHGHVLEATAKGSVTLEMFLPNGGSQKCTLKNVQSSPTTCLVYLSI